MTKYKLTESGVINNETGAHIPLGHWMYHEYEKWVSLGNTADPIYTLDEVKTKKKIEIERDRDEAIAQQVFVHNRYWQARPTDVDNLSQEILTVQAGVPISPVWRDANNDNMVLTNVSQLIEIAAAMKVQKLTAYQNSWIRKASVDAATTIEEVEAI